MPRAMADAGLLSGLLVMGRWLSHIGDRRRYLQRDFHSAGTIVGEECLGLLFGCASEQIDGLLSEFGV